MSGMTIKIRNSSDADMWIKHLLGKSGKSDMGSTSTPASKRQISYIRSLAPSARIVVNETLWSAWTAPKIDSTPTVKVVEMSGFSKMSRRERALLKRGEVPASIYAGIKNQG